jgi:hypothetical protein
MSKTTCYSCRHSVSDHRPPVFLWCTANQASCKATCDKYEREAGADEPEDTN